MRGFLSLLSWLFGILIALGLVGAVAWMVVGPAVKERIASSQGAQGELVRLETVTVGPLTRRISAPGIVEATERVSISSRISAQIQALPFDEGDSVRPGDVVVQLDDRDLKAQLDSAEAQLKAEEARLEGARASHVIAVSEWERQTSLYGSNDVSKSTLEAAEAEKNRAESSLRAAEAAIEIAKANITRVREDLRYATIASPITGTVTVVNAEVGELVVTGTMNNAGTVILEIANLGEMIVRTEVDETDIAEVRVGQKAQVYINAYPDEVFDGVVQKISLERRRPGRRQIVAQANNTDIFEVEVLLDLEGRTILSGLTASVEIEVETIEDAMLVPSQAVKDVRIDELPDEVTRDNPNVNKDKTYARVVFTLVDGEVKAVPVVTGASDLRTTAIRAGVGSEDKIVVGPYKALLAMKHGNKARDEEVVKAEEEARKKAAEGEATADAAGDGEAEEPADESAAETTDEAADDGAAADSTETASRGGAM